MPQVTKVWYNNAFCLLFWTTFSVHVATLQPVQTSQQGCLHFNVCSSSFDNLCLAQVQAVFMSLLHLVPMECLCSMFLGEKWNLGTVWSFKQSMEGTQDDGSVFGILVVGEMGTGKATLINNLLGQDVVAGSSDWFHTSDCSVVLEGVRVSLYFCGSHLGRKVNAILDKGDIHLVIICLRLPETRMRSTLYHMFRGLHEMGVKWEHTVIALTFADSVPVPASETRRPGFDMASFFDDHVAKKCTFVTHMLLRVGVAPEVAEKIKYCPVMADCNEKLPNGKQWFVPFLLGILEMLSPGATTLQDHSTFTDGECGKCVQ